MQRGTITLHRGSWTLLYWDTQFRDGERKRVRVRKALAQKSDEYPTKSSVRLLADKELQPVNLKQVQPESSLLLTEFIEQQYFPMMKPELKPSTYHGYEGIYAHLKNPLAESKLRVRDFRTVHGQKILRNIDVSHTTLLHIKSFLSGVFKFAKREGVLDGVNPMQDVSVKGRRTKFKGVAYSLEEVFTMLERLQDASERDKLSLGDERPYVDAYEVITLLSLTGLRQGECQGLRWSDYNEENRTLNIQRAVWRTHVGMPKSIASADTIPVIPLLAEMLERRRKQLNPEADDYIFAGTKRLTRYGKKRAPLNLHNLENRIIRPSLQRFTAEQLADPMIKDLLESGKVKQEVYVRWVGYHGFRRGLATNLLSLGVEPIIVAAILRHSDVRTTLEHYNIQQDSKKQEAMQRLESKVREFIHEPK